MLLYCLFENSQETQNNQFPPTVLLVDAFSHPQKNYQRPQTRAGCQPDCVTEIMEKAAIPK